jgi:hypothetical protein
MDDKKSPAGEGGASVSNSSPRLEALLVFNLTVQLRGERMMHWAHQVELGNSDDQGDGAERGE